MKLERNSLTSDPEYTYAHIEVSVRIGLKEIAGLLVKRLYLPGLDSHDVSRVIESLNGEAIEAIVASAYNAAAKVDAGDAENPGFMAPGDPAACTYYTDYLSDEEFKEYVDRAIRAVEVVVTTVPGDRMR